MKNIFCNIFCEGDPPVSTSMRISVAAPQFPRPFRPRKVSQSSAIVEALRTNPIGWWLAIDLATIPGSTAIDKQNSVARGARRYFKPIHVQVEDQQLFIRRVPDPMLPAMAQPIDWSKRQRPAFFRPRPCGQYTRDDR
jgi:hypothetical protein